MDRKIFSKNMKIISLAIVLTLTLLVAITAKDYKVFNENYTKTTTQKVKEKTSNNTEQETTDNSQKPSATNTTNKVPVERPWNLVLVNPDNKLPENHKFTVKNLMNGQAVDERCYEDLQKMMDDCRAAGFKPLICSSYRSLEKQQTLFNNKIAEWKNKGYSEEQAKIEAAKIVAIPGTSEHQLGLALDIVDTSYQILDEKQQDMPAQKWLLENSWKYGFILRYPKDKTSITQITYEPWHYRYVGKDVAKEIFNDKLCLEEYLEK